MRALALAPSLALVAPLILGACGDPCDAPVAGTVCAVAGTGDLGFNGDGKRAERTDFYLLSSVRRGPDGRVYLMDFNNQRLRYLAADGTIATVAGDGDHALAAVGVQATESPLENPVDFDFLPDGRLVFVSYHDPRVLVIERDGTLSALAGNGMIGPRGDEGDGGPALDASFIQLDGVLVARDGAVFVSDSMANRVRVIRGGVITTVVGDGQTGYSGDGGPATIARVHWPTALALDAGGSLFVADTLNHVVRRIAADGTITTVAGTGAAAFGGDGGPATAATLNQPNGLAVDADGTLYVADRANHRIRRIAPDGIISTLAGTGVEGHLGDGGPAVTASFGFVARLSLDGDSLYVADQSNACARRITLR